MRPYNILIMKRILIVFIVFVSATNLLAQHKFNPNKFKVEIHQYIVDSANLTEQESAKLLPIYDEMISKQRVLHKQLRKLQNSNLQNNKNAKSVILKIDDLLIQIKQIEKAYHLKMLRVIPAIKLGEVLKAERYYHKQYFRNAAQKR